MKRLLLALIAALLLLSCMGLADSRYSYDDNLPEYIVCTENYTQRKYVLYMYSKPSASGSAYAAYYNGDVLKMITLNAEGSTYSYVIGPDGRTGYVLTRRIVASGVTDSMNYEGYPVYRVANPNGAYSYMYPQPSSSGDPVTRYDNGSLVRVVNTEVDPNYYFVIGPDRQVGYISKRSLSDNLDPTPAPTNSPTPVPFVTPTPAPTPAPTRRPPSLTPMQRFRNGVTPKLSLVRFDSRYYSYTELDVSSADLADLGAYESYRVLISFYNSTYESFVYTPGARLNGVSYDFDRSTLAARGAEKHLLDVSLTAGDNFVVAYVDGVPLCSIKFTISAYSDYNNGYISSAGLNGCWFNEDETNPSVLVLRPDGSAYLDGAAYTWSCLQNRLRLTRGYETLNFSIVNQGGSFMVYASQPYGAVYFKAEPDALVRGSWNEARSNTLWSLSHDGHMTDGNSVSSWVTAEGRLYIAFDGKVEAWSYVLDGDTLILYDAENMSYRIFTRL